MLTVIGLSVFFLPLVEATSFFWVLVLSSVLFCFVVLQRGKRELIVLILCCLLLHAQWGVVQFILQGDVNLRLLGETELSLDKVGVAKFGADKILRAYGPYTHANSFAGIMVIALVLWVVASVKVNVLRVLSPLSLVFVLAILVSFSRSALMSLVLLVLVVLTRNEFRWRRKQFVGMVLLILIVFAPFYGSRFSDSEDAGVSERLLGYDWSRQLISDNGFWKGLGVGRYKDSLRIMLDEEGVLYNFWQIDYVHSVPLLMISIFGIALSIAIFVLMLGLLFKFVSKFKLVMLLVLVPLILFDHYLITQISPLVFLLLLITV